MGYWRSRREERLRGVINDGRKTGYRQAVNRLAAGVASWRRDDTEATEYVGSDGMKMSMGSRGGDDRSKNLVVEDRHGVCWVSGRIVFATAAQTEQLGLLHQSTYQLRLSSKLLLH
jgi:hypothetical protein